MSKSVLEALCNPISSPPDPHQTRTAPAFPNDGGVESPGATATASCSTYSSGGSAGLISPFPPLTHHLSAGGRRPAQRGPLQRPVGLSRLRGLQTSGLHEDYGRGADWGRGRGRRRESAGQVRAVRGTLRERSGWSGDSRLRRDGEPGQ